MSSTCFDASLLSVVPFSVATGGVRIRVRLTPHAASDRLAGLVSEADGGVALKVTVTAPAEQGKANAALIALLAKTWRVAKRDLAVVIGATDRRKVVHLAGDPALLLPRLVEALGESRSGQSRSGQGGVR